MNGEIRQEVVKLLDQEYTFSCPDEECAGLRESARLLGEKMHEIHASGKVVGGERIAVMAALNLIFELLQQADNAMPAGIRMEERLRRLAARLDSALGQEELQLIDN